MDCTSNSWTRRRSVPGPSGEGGGPAQFRWWHVRRSTCTRKSGTSERRRWTGRPTDTTGSSSAASSPGIVSRATASFLASKLFEDAYIEKPIRWNGFVEDRLDLGDVVVVGGLRYDCYDSRASRPFATDSLGVEFQFPRISTMPGFDLRIPTAGFRRDKSHGYLSPHIQVAFPVTDRTNFRLSLFPSGADTGFRAAPRRHQHRLRQHQHQPRVRHRSGLRQDDRLRVRHPARVQ